MIYYATGSPDRDLKKDDIRAALHRSTENRFRVTYAAGHLTSEEVESVGYSFGNVRELMARYNPEKIMTGFHKTADSEEFYFISNPATGLWKALM